MLSAKLLKPVLFLVALLVFFLRDYYVLIVFTVAIFLVYKMGVFGKVKDWLGKLLSVYSDFQSKKKSKNNFIKSNRKRVYNGGEL